MFLAALDLLLILAGLPGLSLYGGVPADELVLLLLYFLVELMRRCSRLLSNQCAGVPGRFGFVAESVFQITARVFLLCFACSLLTASPVFLTKR